MGNSSSRAKSILGGKNIERCHLLDGEPEQAKVKVSVVMESFWKELNEAASRIHAASSDLKHASSHMKVAYWKITDFSSRLLLATKHSSPKIHQMFQQAQETSKLQEDAIEELMNSANHINNILKELLKKLQELGEKKDDDSEYCYNNQRGGVLELSYNNKL